VHLREDTQGALELIQKALQMDPNSAYLKNQLARFQDLLAKKRLQEPTS
jgi:hypothetical protein